MNELLLMLAAGAGAYFLIKQTPTLAATANTTTTTQVAATDPAVASAVAAAQAAGIVPTEIHQVVSQTQVIPPGSSTAVSQPVTVTTVNTNPGNPSQGIYLMTDVDRGRSYGFYVPDT